MTLPSRAGVELCPTLRPPAGRWARLRGTGLRLSTAVGRGKRKWGAPGGAKMTICTMRHSFRYDYHVTTYEGGSSTFNLSPVIRRQQKAA